MFSFRVRPRIKRYTNHSVEQVLECFNETLESRDFHLDGTIMKNHVLVKIPEEFNHYWSPELQLEVVENYLKDSQYSDDRQENTLIRGFIGPKSTIWTMFMFFYIGFGGLLLVGIIFGTSQSMIDVEANYWYAVLGGIGTLITFIASQIGQKMGEEQTKLFLQFIKKAFSKCECLE